MIAESPAQQDAPDGNSSNRQALSTEIEFLWQALKETANLLMKAITFYLAIAAAILGYVLYHPLAPSLRIIAFWMVMTITMLFTIAVGAVSWGLWTGVRDLQSAQEKLSPETFSQLGLHRFFDRARAVFWIIITTSLLILVILLAAIGRYLLE
ncbi:MAG: hypothetical protein AABN95_24550 [Acidobacteriota bacterium]